MHALPSSCPLRRGRPACHWAGSSPGRWWGPHWAQLSRLHWHGPARGHARPRLSRTRSECRSFTPRAVKWPPPRSRQTAGASPTEHAAATACRCSGCGIWPAVNRSRCPGTEDAALPFWSADSRDLGFFAGGALKRVPAAGGPVRLVTDSIGPWTGYGGSWAVDGTIAVSGENGLFRVPAEGGAMTALTKLPSGDWAHFWPSFLPDGRRFLFTAKLWTRTAEASEQGIYLGLVGQPDDRAASARSLERGVRRAGLSRLCPGGDAYSGAIRSGDGTRHGRADRDRRSGGDGRPVLLRGHFCVSRRDPGGPTAASSRLPRFERAQYGTAPGRSQRHGQPGVRGAAIQLLHGAEPNRQSHGGRLDSRPHVPARGPDR